MLTDNMYIFPNAVKRKSGNETIKLNISDGVLNFYHNGKLNIIDISLLRDGSSTVVLSNGITGKTYVLYNFREILQVLDMYPKEFLTNLSQRCFMQIDKSDGEVFIKVFLLEGMNELPSDTNDFSDRKHLTVDYIHELDWRYSWTVKDIEGRLEDGWLTLRFKVVQSDFWKEPIYISHAGQYIKIENGENTVVFKYIQTEDVYFGAANCRYTGRSINIERLLGGMG